MAREVQKPHLGNTKTNQCSVISHFKFSLCLTRSGTGNICGTIVAVSSHFPKSLRNEASFFNSESLGYESASNIGTDEDDDWPSWALTFIIGTVESCPSVSPFSFSSDSYSWTCPLNSSLSQSKSSSPSSGGTIKSLFKFFLLIPFGGIISFIKSFKLFGLFFSLSHCKMFSFCFLLMQLFFLKLNSLHFHLMHLLPIML